MRRTRNDQSIDLSDNSVSKVLDAINDTARQTRAGVLSSILATAYLLVATISTDQVALLRLDAMELPVLKVGVSVHYFALLAPLIVLVLHFNILSLQLSLSKRVRLLWRLGKASDSSGEAVVNHLGLGRVDQILFASTTLGRLVRSDGARWERFLGCIVHSCVYVLGPLVALLWLLAFFLVLHQPKVTLAQELMVVGDLLLILFFLPPALSSEGTFRSWWFHPVPAGGPGKTGRRGKRRGWIWTMTACGVLVLGWALCTLRIPEECGRAGVDSWLRKLKIHRSFQLRDRYLTLADEDTVDELLKADFTAFKTGGPLGVLRQVNWGFNLRGRDLQCADFSGAILVDADFSGANLKGANFQHATLIGATFLRSEETVSRHELRDPESLPYQLKTLVEQEGSARARPTVLEWANFTGADLRGALFFHSNLDNASLREARVDDTRFLGARLNNADLSQLRGVGTYFTRSQLDNVVLDEANLVCSDFSSTRARFSSLQATVLDGSQFTDAELVGSVFQNASLRGTYDLSPDRIVLYHSKVSAVCGPSAEGLALADLRLVELPAQADDPSSPLSSLLETWREELKDVCASPSVETHATRLLDLSQRLGHGELCLQGGRQVLDRASRNLAVLFEPGRTAAKKLGWSPLAPPPSSAEFYDRLSTKLIAKAAQEEGRWLRLGLLQHLNDVELRRSKEFDDALKRADLNALCRPEGEYSASEICRHSTDAEVCEQSLWMTDFCE
ncbi:MAG: pentapeptide repeat-containing protein [Acidobacteria bacterium]|nr:pentapeptide repeat-containing protein [Acidobacteriota bacterium]